MPRCGLRPEPEKLSLRISPIALPFYNSRPGLFSPIGSERSSYTNFFFKLSRLTASKITSIPFMRL